MNSLLALDAAEAATDPADWWPAVLDDRTATDDTEPSGAR